MSHDVNIRPLVGGAARRLVTAGHIVSVSYLQGASTSESGEVSNRFLPSQYRAIPGRPSEATPPYCGHKGLRWHLPLSHVPKQPSHQTLQLFSCFLFVLALGRHRDPLARPRWHFWGPFRELVRQQHLDIVLVFLPPFLEVFYLESMLVLYHLFRLSVRSWQRDSYPGTQTIRSSRGPKCRCRVDWPIMVYTAWQKIRHSFGFILVGC